MRRGRSKGFGPGRWLSGIFLWVYVSLLVFVWHGARSTPEGAVLIRLAAAILCDIVWIPLGLGLWFSLMHWVFRLILRPSGRLEGLAAMLPAALGAAVLVFGLMDIAFSLLAIPSLALMIRLIISVWRSRRACSVMRNVLLVYLPLSLVLLLTGFHHRHQLLPMPQRPRSNASLRIMTYNLRADGSKEMRAQAIATIRREAPDVLFLQELRPSECEFLIRRELGDRYPYMLTTAGRVHRAGDIVAVLSRHPLTLFSPEGFGSAEEGIRRMLFAILEIEGQRICAASVHLQSGGRGLEEAARRRLSPHETMERISPREISIEALRRRHAIYLAGTILEAGLPAILAGDVNDTPNSRVYKILDAPLDNAFARRGRGLGGTFGESWIIGKRRLRETPLIGLLARDLLRIDHVFVSPDLEVLSARVVKDAEGSDHKPLVVDISLDRLLER